MQSDRTFALMSLHPRFAERILRGEKRVEFRKARLPSTVSTVIIYATRPVGRIIGAFSVAGIDEGHPEELWERHKAYAGVGEAFFRKYFEGRNRGFAIRVGETLQLNEPRSISAVRADPPQSFCYLRERDVRRLLADAKATAPEGSNSNLHLPSFARR